MTIENRPTPADGDPKGIASTGPSEPSGARRATTDGFEQVLRRLAHLRRSARVLLVVQRLAWALAAVLVAGLIAGVVDYALRWPRELRVFLWVMTVGLLALAAWRAIYSAWRFTPTLTQVALRIEGLFPSLQGWLAAGVDLFTRGHESAGDPEGPSRLAASVIAEARSRFERERPGALLRRAPAYRAVVGLGAVMLLLLLLATVSPRNMAIGARRVATPWTNVQWPKRTGVVDATGVLVHPLGTALALRAGLTHSDRSPEETRVAAVYRVLQNGRELVGERRVLLTSQGRAVDEMDANTGALFERLIEPSGLSAEQASSPGRRADRASGADEGAPARELTLEYHFETQDDRTDTQRVLLVEPPSVRKAELRIEPPRYAAPGAPEASAGTRTYDLGSGSDERAAPPPALAGSRADLTIHFNKALPVPPGAPLDGERAARWARAALGEDAAAMLASTVGGAPGEANGEADAEVLDNAPAVVDFEDGGRVWRLSWRLDRAVKMTVGAVDEHGIENSEESTFVFEAQRDAEPGVVVTAPDEDRSVLATAVVEVAAEARDDVGLSYLRLERQHARRPAGSAGAPVEAIEDRAEFADALPASLTPGDAPAASMRELKTRSTLDLSTLPLEPGDEVWITAVAADAFNLDGRRHEPVRSQVRRLRIMSRQELVEQVWAELGGLRRSAMAIDEDQAKTQRSLSEADAERSAKGLDQAARAQAGLTERLRRQEESINRAQRQIDQNQLADEGLQRVLDEARSALRGAQHQSETAASKAAQSAGSAKQAEESRATDPPSSERRAKESQKAASEGGQAQEEVRDDLADLVGLLDQGQDTWASKRAIERLIEEQQRLMDKTAQTGEQTRGREAKDLSPAEAKSLADLAREQAAAGEKLRDAVDKMLENHEQVKRSDPAGAEGMKQAAQKARKEGVQDRMEEASRQIQDNQTSNAQQQQSRALESMKQMLQSMEESAQNRDQVLRRQLASLMESIQGLIEQQKTEIESLVAAENSGDDRALEALGAPMARLHQNTLGVMDEALSGPRETQGVARIIEKAAAAQQAAATALRDRPINTDEAGDQEQTSLRRLEEALAQAQNVDEQAEEREEARLRNELKGKYAQTLDRQVTIRDATAELVGAEENRRTRNSARLLGQDQETLRRELAKMLDETKELRDASVFEFAHQRLDELMSRSAQTLGEGRAEADTTRRQASSIRILQSIVRSLDNRKKKQDDFRSGEGGQQGGGGGAGGQGKGLPPAAELRLLRALQEEAMLATREVGENPRATPQDIAEVAKLQKELAERGRALLEKVSEQAPSAAPGGRAGDRPPAPGPEGEPTPQPDKPEAEPGTEEPS
ncbi:MAG TPA: hypothetical protein PL072_00790 [Phycisphaerales bacterium]|nr:hypothetical protein [Phycisphaerales bacterium]